MLYRLLAVYSCKLALVGHRHKCTDYKHTRIVPNGKTAKGDMSFAMLCGSMLGAFIKPPGGNKIATDTYVERAGYPPQAPGLAWATCIPDKMHLETHNSISLEPVQLAFDA